MYVLPVKGILWFVLVHADRLTPLHISGVCVFFVCATVGTRFWLARSGFLALIENNETMAAVHPFIPLL